MLLACATRQELARQVQYLKVENEILRSKLPKKLTVTPEERPPCPRGSETRDGHQRADHDRRPTDISALDQRRA
jgi:hypothetical protein